jgi:hypothetical protein
MNVTLSWHETIAWTTTIVFLTLWSTERRKKRPRYDSLVEGILSTISMRARFLAVVVDLLNGSIRPIPREEAILAVSSEFNNYVALHQQVIGVLKALDPANDVSFDNELTLLPLNTPSPRAS